MTNPVRLRLTAYNARLIDARKAKGLTQKDLSLLTGIRLSYLSHIETLRAIPSQQKIDEICSALDLSEDYLFPPSLLEALREGVFDHRVVELEEKQIIRLTETRRAGLLQLGITEREALDEVQKAVDNDLLKQRLPDILKTLNPREQEVIELRFGLKDGTPRTLDEVSFHFINKKTGTHLTRDRIRQIESKALRKLRHPSRSRKLKDFLNYGV